MSDPRYANVGHPVDRVIEEVGELLQAICKARRFGLHNSHPDRPERTNLDDIRYEMEDCNEAFAKLEVWLKEERYKHYKETHNVQG